MADRFNYHSHCVYNLGYHIGHISEETVRRYIEYQKETAQRKAGSLSSHG